MTWSPFKTVSREKLWYWELLTMVVLFNPVFNALIVFFPKLEFQTRVQEFYSCCQNSLQDHGWAFFVLSLESILKVFIRMAWLLIQETKTVFFLVVKFTAINHTGMQYHKGWNFFCRKVRNAASVVFLMGHSCEVSCQILYLINQTIFLSKCNLALILRYLTKLTWVGDIGIFCRCKLWRFCLLVIFFLENMTKYPLDLGNLENYENLF